MLKVQTTFPSIASLLWRLIKKIGAPLFVLLFLQNGVEQFLTELIQTNISSPTGATNWVWVYGALNILFSILFPLAETAVVFLALYKILSEGRGRRGTLYGELVKETLRAYGLIFWGALCFIVPGIVLFFRYLFVPFVVGFDVDYAKGDRDALLASRDVWRKNRLKTIVYVFLFMLVFPFLMSFGDDWNKPFRLPLWSVPFLAVESVLLIWGHLILFKMWRRVNV